MSSNRKSSAPAHTTDPTTRAGDPFAHAGEERPHACTNGWVTIGHIVIEPETGEEVEEYAQYLCKRCKQAK